MKTKKEIHDSLYKKPITKAALYAVFALRNMANDSRFEFRESYLRRADSICARFKVSDLVLRFRSAPIN